MARAEFRPRYFKRSAGLAALLALGGCVADLPPREERLGASFGDATLANKAVHIGNPWPRDSFDTNLPSDGPRSAPSLQQYRTGQPLGGGSAAVSTR